MHDEKTRPDPTPESLAEIPEVDFSRAVRPNRFANLRGDFRHAVFLAPDLWAHFGSEAKVLEALELLVDLARGEVQPHVPDAGTERARRDDS